MVVLSIKRDQPGSDISTCATDFLAEIGNKDSIESLLDPSISYSLVASVRLERIFALSQALADVLK